MSTTATATIAEHSSRIDALLEEYLQLLDTYTTLRSELSRAVSSIHQSLARANFSSPNPRGLRWGEEAVYAASGSREMRAERRVEVVDDGEGDVKIQVVGLNTALGDTDEKDEDEKEEGEEEGEDGEGRDETRGKGKEEKEKDKDKGKTTPLFGILLPPALRAARDESVGMVQGVVPRLAEVEARMRAVEVEVRRARKRMGKAEKGR